MLNWVENSVKIRGNVKDIKILEKILKRKIREKHVENQRVWGAYREKVINNPPNHYSASLFSRTQPCTIPPSL